MKSFKHVSIQALALAALAISLMGMGKPSSTSHGAPGTWSCVAETVDQGFSTGPAGTLTEYDKTVYFRGKACPTLDEAREDAIAGCNKLYKTQYCYVNSLLGEERCQQN